jgi:hypothetical protein
MTATTAATVAAPEMIGRRENYQALLEIKIPRQDFQRRRLLAIIPMELGHAIAADAGFVS